VADLADGDEVVIGTVAGVQVQVVDGQCAAGGGIVGVATILAAPVGGVFDADGDVGPVVGVGIHVLARFTIWTHWSDM